MNQDSLNKIDIIYLLCGVNVEHEYIITYFRTETYTRNNVSASSLNALPSDDQMDYISQASSYNIVFPPNIKMGLPGSSPEIVDLKDLLDSNQRCSIFYVEENIPILCGGNLIHMDGREALRVQVEGVTIVKVEDLANLVRQDAEQEIRNSEEVCELSPFSTFATSRKLVWDLVPNLS